MKLTKNFSKSEFDCSCGCEMPTDVLQQVQKVAHYDIRKNKARWSYIK